MTYCFTALLQDNAGYREDIPQICSLFLKIQLVRRVELIQESIYQPFHIL